MLCHHHCCHHHHHYFDVNCPSGENLVGTCNSLIAVSPTHLFPNIQSRRDIYMYTYKVDKTHQTNKYKTSSQRYKVDKTYQTSQNYRVQKTSPHSPPLKHIICLSSNKYKTSSQTSKTYKVQKTYLLCFSLLSLITHFLRTVILIFLKIIIFTSRLVLLLHSWYILSNYVIAIRKRT